MIAISASIGKDHYRTLVSNGRGHSLEADEPLELGGSNAAFAPDEILAGALATCSIITMRMYADRKNWPLEKIEMEVDFERIGLISKFSKKVQFIGNLTAEQQQRLISIGDKCPVHKTFSNPIEIISVIQ
jgi:putative redox protein